MAQNGNTLGATILVHFHQNKLFKNKFFILVLFGLASVLATFQKIGQIFYKVSGHPAHNPKIKGSNLTINTERHSLPG
jgi:hypothetical protein